MTYFWKLGRITKTKTFEGAGAKSEHSGWTKKAACLKHIQGKRHPWYSPSFNFFFLLLCSFSRDGIRLSRAVHERRDHQWGVHNPASKLRALWSLLWDDSWYVEQNSFRFWTCCFIRWNMFWSFFLCFSIQTADGQWFRGAKMVQWTLTSSGMPTRKASAAWMVNAFEFYFTGWLVQCSDRLSAF